MKGQILDFSVQENSGIISGSDGARYSFEGADWKGDRPPSRGMLADFEADGNHTKSSNSQFAKKSSGSLSQNLSSAPQKGSIYLLNRKKTKYLTPSRQDAKKYKNGSRKWRKN